MWKINRAAKGWGQREREGRWHVHVDYARAERRVGLQSNGVLTEASTGGARAPGQHNFTSKVVSAILLLKGSQTLTCRCL